MLANQWGRSYALVLFLFPLLCGVIAMPAMSAPPVSESLADRRARLDEMSQADRDRLLRSLQRFEQMPEAEQQRLRDLHRDLARDPESEQLRDVMQRYQEWLKSLPASQRAELPKLSNEERIERIKKWQAEEQRRAGRRLSLVDVQALLVWLDTRVLLAVSEDDRKRYEKTTSPRERRAQIREHLEDARVRGALRQVSDKEIEELKGRLSDDGRRVLEEAQTAGRDEVRKVLYFWIAQSRGGLDDLQMLDIKHEDLALYFDTLSERDRDELLALSPDEMWHRLARRYLRENSSGSFSGRRPGGPRPDRRGSDERAGERGGVERGSVERGRDERGSERGPERGPPQRSNDSPGKSPRSRGN
jgi:hypothetical protein